MSKLIADANAAYTTAFTLPSRRGSLVIRDFMKANLSKAGKFKPLFEATLSILACGELFPLRLKDPAYIKLLAEWAPHVGLERRCHACKKPMAPKSIYKPSKQIYCSRVCKNNCPDSLAKREVTFLKRYGGSPNAHPDVKEKKRLAYQRRYGVDNPAKSAKVKAKTKATWLEKYGHDSPFKDPAIQSKRLETWARNYGTSHPWKNQDVTNARMQTLVDRYGEDNPQKVASIRRKTEKTNIKRYGAVCAASSEHGKAVAEATCLERYGVRSPSQSAELRDRIIKASFATKTLTLRGRTFEGLQGVEPQAITWFLKKNPHLLRRVKTLQVDVGTFQYKKNGKSHVYMPDFRVNDTIFEVKSLYTFGVGKGADSRARRTILRRKLKAVEKAGFNVVLLVEISEGKFYAHRGSDFSLAAVRRARWPYARLNAF